MNYSEPESMIACIRDPAHGAMILKEAAHAARLCGADLQIVSVSPAEENEAEKSRRIEELYRLSRTFGAEMHIVFDHNPVLAAAAFVHDCNTPVVFTGMPSDGPNSFVVLLRKLLPQIMISMVSEEGITYRLYPHAIPAVH